MSREWSLLDQTLVKWVDELTFLQHGSPSAKMFGENVVDVQVSPTWFGYTCVGTMRCRRCDAGGVDVGALKFSDDALH